MRGSLITVSVWAKWLTENQSASLRTARTGLLCLWFYLDYLMAGKTEDCLLQSLSSAVTETVQDSENRLARMDFKIAVDPQVIAYTHDVDEDAYRYQRREI